MSDSPSKETSRTKTFEDSPQDSIAEVVRRRNLSCLTEDFAATGVFCDEVDHSFRLHDLVHTNDVRMAQQLHDLDLAKNFLQVVVAQLRFVDDFNRHLKRGQNVDDDDNNIVITVDEEAIPRNIISWNRLFIHRRRE